MKIGIFGGSFNPPHNMHVKIAQEATSQLKLDKLFAVPCGDPPHKRCDLDKLERLKLSRLAFDGVADTWDYEIVKEGKSYTVETLREVTRLYPDCELYLVIGGDSLRSFDRWYRFEEIASLATLAVAQRTNELFDADLNNLRGKCNAKIVTLNLLPDTVSSSEVRLRYQFGMDNSAYVPPQVNDYILKNGLYSRFRDMAAKLKGYLKPERLTHTFYVVKRGLEFASADEYDKAFIACLLHDAAKYIDEADYGKYGFVKPEDMPEPIVHSFLGAKVAKLDFGIDDSEILDAIKYHTTGRPNMTRLDKIVYVADKTEQTRPYPLEHLLTGTLDEIFLKCLAEANEYRQQAHGDSDFSLTNETLEFYLK